MLLLFITLLLIFRNLNFNTTESLFVCFDFDTTESLFLCLDFDTTESLIVPGICSWLIGQTAKASKSYRMSPAIEAVAVINMTQESSILTMEDILALDRINVILLAVGLFCSMFIMGCGYSHTDFSWQVKHPKGILIGVCIVDFLMPVTGNFASRLLSLNPPDAMTLTVLASCPTDGLSSVFTLWTNSEVCLR